MKKIYTLLLLIPFHIFAKSHIVSKIPLPSIHIQNLNPLACNEKCLNGFLRQGMIFSFLAFANPKLYAETELNELNYEVIKNSYTSKAQIIPPSQTNKLKIALLLPYKTIGKYSTTTTNATLAYLIQKNYPFDVKSYKIESENYEDINKALLQIKKDNFNFVIAPLTKSGESAISKVQTDTIVYIPTINKKESSSSNANIYYGGIDYGSQNKKLLSYTGNKVIIFSDNSNISQQLTNIQETYIKNSNPATSIKKYTIPEKTTNLESILKGNSRVDGATIFINTPIVKSSMIISQLTLFDLNADNILSLQTNYSPLLFSMTQFKDRKNMIIANSISQNSDELVEINSLLDNDISYDWINYTTTVGVDYFAHLMYGESRSYDIEVQSNGMIYPIELITSSTTKFIPYGEKAD